MPADDPTWCPHCHGWTTPDDPTPGCPLCEGEPEAEAVLVEWMTLRAEAEAAGRGDRDPGRVGLGPWRAEA